MRRSTIPPRLLLSGLVGALVASTYLIGVEGPRPLALAGTGLLLVIVLASFARVVVAGGWIVAFLASLLYVGVAVLAIPFQDLRWTAAAGAVIGYFVTALFAEAFAGRFYGIVGTLNRSEALVEELTIRDSMTGTVKPHYARHMLSDELQRAQRYQRPVSVAMIGLDETQDQPTDTDWDEVFARVGHAIAARLRTTDRVSFMDNPPRFLCILVETPLDGAKIVTDRIIEDIRASTGIQFYSGLAAFPDDAVDAAGLMEEARSALEFASITGEPLAHRDLLRA